MTCLTRVRTREQIADVVNLAREIWTEHYVSIIGQEQVAYMLGKFQSGSAIAAQLAEGYEYYTISHAGKIAGYMAIVPDEDTGKVMLSKLYVRKSGRGHGFGRAMLEFAEDHCRKRRIRTLWLTVNKHNRHSLAWYRRMGFKNVGSTVQDIGGGFVMDDFRMEKAIQ
jgi:diamine N-acetyltransferase